MFQIYLTIVWKQTYGLLTTKQYFYRKVSVTIYIQSYSVFAFMKKKREQYTLCWYSMGNLCNLSVEYIYSVTGRARLDACNIKDKDNCSLHEEGLNLELC